MRAVACRLRRVACGLPLAWLVGLVSRARSLCWFCGAVVAALPPSSAARVLIRASASSPCPHAGHHAQTNEDLFYATCQQYKEYCNNASVLQHILGCFKPQLISKYALNMTTYIKEADENTQVPKVIQTLSLALRLVAPARFLLVPPTHLETCCSRVRATQSKLYLALGRSLILSQPPASQRLPILNDVWKVIRSLRPCIVLDFSA